MDVGCYAGHGRPTADPTQETRLHCKNARLLPQPSVAVALRPRTEVLLEKTALLSASGGAARAAHQVGVAPAARAGLDQATSGQGDAIFDWVMAAVDITKGKQQDKIRVAYEAVKVAKTDGPVQLIKAIESKWWLFKQKTAYEIPLRLVGSEMSIRVRWYSYLRSIIRR